MAIRAMIVVGAGSSTRFGSDKLLADVGGRPLIAHTLDIVAGHVDVCVLVTGERTAEAVARSHPNVVLAPGGATRTRSEMAGLAALTAMLDLVGIHDAARPAVPGQLIESLFITAEARGGAVPVLDQPGLVLDRGSLSPVIGVKRAQTPQVFRAPELVHAYRLAEQVGFEGFDTAEVMHRFSDVEIVGVEGHPSNTKVTFPADLDDMTIRLTGPPPD